MPHSRAREDTAQPSRLHIFFRTSVNKDAGKVFWVVPNRHHMTRLSPGDRYRVPVTYVEQCQSIRLNGPLRDGQKPY